MALTKITFAPQEQTNLVVQGKPGLIKVAGGASGTLGVVQAEGTFTGTVTWALIGNPGGAVSISADPADSSKATLLFSQVPIRTEPWLMIIQASTLTDGKVLQIPLAVVVRETFSLREQSHPGGDFTLTGKTCDPTLPTLVFQGFGPGGAANDVRFIPPTSIPAGLTFGVDDNDTAYLIPNPSTASNPVGGIPGNTGSTYTVVLKAYKDGTLYDSPENPATITVTYDLTQGPKTGVRHFNLGASYSRNSKSILLDAVLAYVGGRSPASGWTIEWSHNGQGTWDETPGEQDVSVSWTPDTAVGDQSVTFTAVVKEGGVEVATASVGPFPVSDAADWTDGTSAQVTLYPEKLYPQESGKHVYFRVSLPDLLPGESAIVTPSIVSVDGAPAVQDTPNHVTVNGGGTNDAVFGFTVPSAATLYQLYRVRLSVAVTGGSKDRTGFAQLLAICTGPSPLIAQIADNTLSGNTGSLLSPTTIRAFRWQQNSKPSNPTNLYLNPIPSTNNSTLVEVTGCTFLVSGAPEGLEPVVDIGSGFYQLTGLITKAGTFNFNVIASKAGYVSGPDASENVTLVAGTSQVRATFTAFSSTNPTVAGGQGFTLSWGIQGTGTLTLQANNHLPAADVTGSQSSNIPSITDSTVYILRSKNVLGESWSVPIMVGLGAQGSSTQLPPSPAIANVDEKEHVTLVWQPYSINNSYAPYANWEISLKDTPSETPYLAQTALKSTQITGLEQPFGGTSDARHFEFDLAVSGYHEMSMKAIAAVIPGQLLINSLPWDEFHKFPAPRTFTLDKNTASKGEAITVSISGFDSNLGLSGDRWQMVYSDGTTSDWFPFSITSVAKAFTEGGKSQTMKLVVESDYATAYPPVKLRRSYTLSVFIQDQDYLSTGEVYDVTGAIVGVGSEKGFEISNNLGGAVTPKPYLVVVPSIVRDDMTNELKLMVATARGADASSLLGTMALDVFPLAGRPHTTDLVKLPDEFVRSSGILVDPVQITQDALSDVIVGQNMTPIMLQAEGGQEPYRWFAVDLPYGLHLSRDGRLSGAAQKLGRFPITISVQDAQEPSSIDNKTLYLTAKSDLNILPPTLTTPIVGESYKGQLQAQRGIQPYAWEKVAGDLPAGLTLNVDGTITGWPVTYNTAADLTEIYTFVAQVTDAIGALATRQINLQLAPMPLQILNPDQGTIVEGESFKLKFPVVGGYPGYEIVGAPVAPAGFIASTKMVNGMIEIMTRDAFVSKDEAPVHVGIKVRDSKGTEVYAEFTLLTRTPVPVGRWIAPSFQGRVTDTAKAQTVALGGAPSGIGYSSLEVLPPANGLTLAGDALKGTMTLTGPATSEVNQELSFRATLTQGRFTLGKISREYTLLPVMGDSPNTWTVKTLPVRLGDIFAIDIQAPGLNAPTPAALAGDAAGLKVRVKEGEVMPVGMSLDEASGVLYGAIQTLDSATQTKLEVYNSSMQVVSTITLQWVFVDKAIQVTGEFSDAEVGREVNDALRVSGAASSIVAEILHGRLPEGLSLLVDTDNSVLLQGRPLETGYFDLWIRVRDTLNRTGLFFNRLVVDYLRYLAVATDNLPKIIQGFPYSNKLQAVGGAGGYTWEVDNGYVLPDGIILDADGTLHGTAPIGATFTRNISFTVTDAYGQTASAVITLTIAAAPPLVISTSTLPPGQVGSAYIGAQLQATGGVPGPGNSYTWPQVALPAGLSLDSATGIISGTPTAPNSAAISFKVRDSMNQETTKAIPLSILQVGALHVTTDSLPKGRMTEVYGVTGSHAPIFVAGDTGSPRVGGWAARAQFGSKTYILTGGGLCSLRSSHVRDQAFGDVQILDPDVVVNGIQVGQYAPLASDVVDLNNPDSVHPMGVWNLQDRLLSACVQLNNSEFVLIGGAYMGGLNAPSYTGYAGRAIQDGLATTGSLDTDDLEVTKMSPVCFVTAALVNNQRVLKLTPGPTMTSGTGPTPAPGTGLGVGEGRYGMAATLLNDGRVFACGGTAVVHTPGPNGTTTTMLDSRITGKEAYVMTLGVNRAQSSWARVADMPVALVCAKAVTLTDGRVLVTGGLVRSGATYADIVGSTTCLIYTPNTNTWATGPALPARSFTHSMVVLADGRVLIGGSQSGPVPGALFILDAGLTTWTQWLAYTDFAPACWGNMLVLDDGEGFWMGGVHAAPWGAVTDGANGKALLIPDYTNYANEAAIQAADYSGSYAWAAEDGEFGTYLFQTNTQNVIQLAAAGGVPPYATWTASALPTGMTLAPATGILSGTPTAAFDQVVNFTCNDSTAPAAGGPKTSPVKPIRLTVIDVNAPIWVTKSLKTGHLEEDYAMQLAAKDGNDVVLTGDVSISPNSQFGFPAGITLSSSGMISGKTSTPWSRPVVFRWINPAHPTVYTDQEFLVEFVCNTNIPVQAPPAICPNADYSYQLAVTGGKGPYNWSIPNTGDQLPTGLLLNASTGLISGIAAPVVDKDLSITINVSDPNGCTDSQVLSFKVRNAQFIVSPSALAATYGRPFSQVLSVTGGAAPYKFTIKGLPTGFDYNATTGEIFTKMCAVLPKVYPLRIRVQDATKAFADTIVNLTVTGPSTLWFSGPMVADGPGLPMWITNLTEPMLAYLPLVPGLTFDYKRRGHVAPGWLVGDPWTVVVRGEFKTLVPTLAVKDYKGTPWITELISMNADKTEARFGISMPASVWDGNPASLPVIEWSNAGAKNLDMSLNDGGTVITATFHLVTPTAAFAATAMTVEDATGATFRDIASYTNANGSGFIAQ